MSQEHLPACDGTLGRSSDTAFDIVQGCVCDPLMRGNPNHLGRRAHIQLVWDVGGLLRTAAHHLEVWPTPPGVV